MRLGPSPAQASHQVQASHQPCVALCQAVDKAPSLLAVSKKGGGFPESLEEWVGAGRAPRA